MGVAWLGRQDSGGSSVQMPPGGYKACSRYQNTLGTDLTIATATAHWGADMGTHAVKIVAYTDVAGVPTALVATSIEFNGALGSLHQFTFPTPWVWSAGAWMWVGVICADTLNGANQHVVTNGVAYNINSYGTPSNPFGSYSSASFQYHIWCEGYDAMHRLGRISTLDGRDAGHPLGVYLKYDPHFDKFTLGGVEAPMDGQSEVSVSSIFAHFTNTNGTVKTHCAIYSGGGTYTPLAANLVGETNELTGVAPGWQEYTFTPPLTLPAGDYWIGIVSDNDSCNCNVAAYGSFLSTAGASFTDTDFYDFPDPIPAAGGIYPLLYDQHPYGINIYAAYEPIIPPTGGGARSFVGMGESFFG